MQNKSTLKRIGELHSWAESEVDLSICPSKNWLAWRNVRGARVTSSSIRGIKTMLVELIRIYHFTPSPDEKVFLLSSSDDVSWNLWCRSFFKEFSNLSSDSLKQPLLFKLRNVFSSFHFRQRLLSLAQTSFHLASDKKVTSLHLVCIKTGISNIS